MKEEIRMIRYVQVDLTTVPLERVDGECDGLYYHAEDVTAKVQALVDAAEDLLREAVVLSRSYLDAFKDWPEDKEIQGWEKARWLRAAAAADKARAALAAVKEGK